MCFILFFTLNSPSCSIFDMQLMYYCKIGESTYSAWIVVQMLFLESVGCLYYNTDFHGKTRSHARDAARSPALVRTWMDYSETRLLFFVCLLLFFFLLKPIRGSLVPGFPRALSFLVVMRRRKLSSVMRQIINIHFKNGVPTNKKQ